MNQLAHLVPKIVGLLEGTLSEQEQTELLGALSARPYGRSTLVRVASLLSMIERGFQGMPDFDERFNADFALFAEAPERVPQARRQRVEQVLQVSPGRRERLAHLQREVRELASDPAQVGTAPVLFHYAVRWLTAEIEVLRGGTTPGDAAAVPARGQTYKDVVRLVDRTDKLELEMLLQRRPDGSWHLSARAVGRSTLHPTQGRYSLREAAGAVCAAGELRDGCADMRLAADGDYLLTLGTDDGEISVRLVLQP